MASAPTLANAEPAPADSCHLDGAYVMGTVLEVRRVPFDGRHWEEAIAGLRSGEAGR